MEPRCRCTAAFPDCFSAIVLYVRMGEEDEDPPGPAKGCGPAPWQRTNRGPPPLVSRVSDSQAKPNQSRSYASNFCPARVSVSCLQGAEEAERGSVAVVGWRREGGLRPPSFCRLHKAPALPSVTDYCNEELKSQNTKEAAAHCFGCQN